MEDFSYLVLQQTLEYDLPRDILLTIFHYRVMDKSQVTWKTAYLETIKGQGFLTPFLKTADITHCQKILLWAL